MPDADSDNKIGELRSKLTSVNWKICRCEKELTVENVKLDKAKQAEDADKVLIYEKSANQKRTELVRYLDLKVGIEKRIASLEYERMMLSLMNGMNLSDLSRTTENNQKISKLHEVERPGQCDSLGKFGKAKG